MSEVVSLVNSLKVNPRFGDLLAVPVGELVFLHDGWVLSVEPEWFAESPDVTLLFSNQDKFEHHEFPIVPGRVLNLPCCDFVFFFLVRAIVFCDGKPVRVVFEWYEQAVKQAS